MTDEGEGSSHTPTTGREGTLTPSFYSSNAEFTQTSLSRDDLVTPKDGTLTPTSFRDGALTPISYSERALTPSSFDRDGAQSPEVMGQRLQEAELVRNFKL